MTNTSFNLENGIFLPFSPEATGVGIPGQFTTWSTDNKIGPAGTPSGALLDQLTGFTGTGYVTRTGPGAYGFTSASPTTYDTTAAFQAATPPAGASITVKAVTGTWPPASGRDATPLTYRPVSSTTGLFGEMTVGGQLYAPVYSTNPVNMGEFGVVGDAVSSMQSAATWIVATADGTNVLTTSSTTGLAVGMLIANTNWNTLGAGAVPAGTTVVSFVANTSITLSNNAPAGSSLLFVAWPDTLTGTDNTAAMQAAIDFALQNKYTDIRLPGGSYKITDTLNFGWGSLCELHFSGTKRNNFAGAISGPVIYSTKTDRPCINFQGCRTSSITGITVIGRNKLPLLYAQTFSNAFRTPPMYSGRSSNPLDWMAPNLTPTGSNPGGISVNAPYAGITLDAYSGTGTPPTNRYPDQPFPAWYLAANPSAHQYAGGASSDFTVEDCEVTGFGVGICIKPNFDGNGDFTRFRSLILEANVYSIAVCQTQARNVECRNVNLNGHHTGFTNLDFGLKEGSWIGPIDNCSSGGSYQLFNLGTDFGGPITINNFYTEDTVRIGNFVKAASFGPGAIINGGIFGLNNEAFNIPKSYIGGNANVTLNEVYINGSTRIANLMDGVGYLTINGGTWNSANSSGGTTALAQAVNYCGGILVGSPRFNSNFFNRLTAHNLTGTSYPTVGGGQAASFYDDVIGGNTVALRMPMTQFAKRYRDSTNRNWGMTIPTEGFFSMSNATVVPSPPSYVNDVMTFTYSATTFASSSTQAIAPGDILYAQITGTLFVVTSVSGPSGGNYTITTQQQNNLITDLNNSFLVNQNTDPTLASGQTIIVKTGVVLPAQLEYGTFTSASSNITGVTRGDTFGGNLSSYYAAGDLLFGPTWSNPVNPWPIPSNGAFTIASVTNGSPGSATLSAHASSSGVFPIFPFELR